MLAGVLHAGVVCVLGVVVVVGGGGASQCYILIRSVAGASAGCWVYTCVFCLWTARMLDSVTSGGCGVPRAVWDSGGSVHAAAA